MLDSDEEVGMLFEVLDGVEVFKASLVLVFDGGGLVVVVVSLPDPWPLPDVVVVFLAPAVSPPSDWPEFEDEVSLFCFEGAASTVSGVKVLLKMKSTPGMTYAV